MEALGASEELPHHVKVVPQSGEWAATRRQLDPKQIGYVFSCSGRRSRVNVINRDGGQSGW